MELNDAPEQLCRARKEAQAASSDAARLAATVTMPWDETYTGSTLVDMYLAELATHAAHVMLRAEYRNQMGEGSPFGPEVYVPADGTSWERLAACIGRQPRPPSP